MLCTWIKQSLMHSVKSVSWCIVWTTNSSPCTAMLFDQLMLLALLCKHRMSQHVAWGLSVRCILLVSILFCLLIRSADIELWAHALEVSHNKKIKGGRDATGHSQFGAAWGFTLACNQRKCASSWLPWLSICVGRFKVSDCSSTSTVSLQQITGYMPTA